MTEWRKFQGSFSLTGFHRERVLRPICQSLFRRGCRRPGIGNVQVGIFGSFFNQCLQREF